jgi:hypothetical protein
MSAVVFPLQASKQASKQFNDEVYFAWMQGRKAVGNLSCLFQDTCVHCCVAVAVPPVPLMCHSQDGTVYDLR